MVYDWTQLGIKEITNFSTLPIYLTSPKRLNIVPDPIYPTIYPI